MYNYIHKIKFQHEIWITCKHEIYCSPSIYNYYFQEILPSLYCVNVACTWTLTISKHISNVASLVPRPTQLSIASSMGSNIRIERMVERIWLYMAHNSTKSKLPVTYQTHPASRGDCFTHQVLSLPFFQLCHAHMRKNTRLSLHFCIPSDEKLGRGLERGYYRSLQVAWMLK